MVVIQYYGIYQSNIYIRYHGIATVLFVRHHSIFPVFNVARNKPVLDLSPTGFL